MACVTEHYYNKLIDMDFVLFTCNNIITVF